IPAPTVIPTTMASPSARRSERLRSAIRPENVHQKKQGRCVLAPLLLSCGCSSYGRRRDPPPLLPWFPPPPPPPPPFPRQLGAARKWGRGRGRSEEHTSELQSRGHLVCRLLLEKKKKNRNNLDGLPAAPHPEPHHHSRRRCRLAHPRDVRSNVDTRSSHSPAASHRTASIIALTP